MKSVVQYQNKSEQVVALILLYGDESFKDELNWLIFNATVDFVLSPNGFHGPLYLLWIHGCFPFIHDYMATILQFLKY